MKRINIWFFITVLLIATLLIAASISDNILRIGDGNPANDKLINMSDGQIKWNQATSTLQFSNNGGGLFQDVSAGAAATIDIQDYTLVDSVGNSTVQQAAGHVLETTSFSTVNAPEGLWELHGLTDKSGNAHTLTNVSSVAFTASGIFAGASTADFVFASSQCLHTTGVDFDDTASFSTGGWFLFDTTGTTEYFISKAGTANADKSFLFGHDTSGTRLALDVFYNSSGATVSVSIDDGTITDSKWHLIIAIYDQSNTKLLLYVDGVEVANVVDANLSARNNGAGSDYSIGALDCSGTPSTFFDGQAENVFYTKNVLGQKDIDLLYSVRYDISSTLTTDKFRGHINVKEDGSDEFISQIGWGGLEVKRDLANDFVYLYGNIFDALDKIKLWVSF